MGKFRKADRLLMENRVVLEEITKSGMIFRVHGDHGDYLVIVDFITKRITCECKWSTINPDEPCSHIIAVKKFVRQNFPESILKLMGWENENRGS